MKRLRNNKGFSLIEMIVASIILSLAVVSICGLGTKSMTAVRSNRDYEVAWDLLDRQLTLIDYAGIEDFINQGQTTGHFGDDESESTHLWAVKFEEGEYDSLYNVQLTVTWGSQRVPRSISVSTVINGSGAEIEEQDDDQQTNEGSR